MKTTKAGIQAHLDVLLAQESYLGGYLKDKLDIAQEEIMLGVALGLSEAKQAKGYKEIKANIESLYNLAFIETFGIDPAALNPITDEIFDEMVESTYKNILASKEVGYFLRETAILTIKNQMNLKSVMIPHVGGTIDDIILGLQSSLTKKTQGAVVKGMLQGDTLNEIKKTVNAIVGKNKSWSAIDTDIRTYVAEMNNQAQALIYQNEEGFTGITNSIIMDKRTSDICKHHYGIKYYIAKGETPTNFMIRAKSNGWLPTRHRNCRCLIIPLYDK